ncbi:hypothetical protein FD18_GL000366 [Lactobacillus taiwanensis DSM 21401]|nr:hypothetical protein [Lactobacillus taiwanensis]KRN00388.1 hypothetical protein FD18_GL000366 [Lactobacillus taiwanensis DSM 21401]
MNNISRKGLELKAIFALVLPSLLLAVASNFSRNIFLGVMMLLILGAVIGLSVPTIVSTWLILILTVLGLSSLTLGDVAIDFYGKTLLLVSFPLGTYLTSQIKECIFRWEICKKNQSSASNITTKILNCKRHIIRRSYIKRLRRFQIARVLKKSRLVDENLCYRRNGQFLIISNTSASAHF